MSHFHSSWCARSRRSGARRRLLLVVAFLVATAYLYAGGSGEYGQPGDSASDGSAQVVIYTYDSFPSTLEDLMVANFAESDVEIVVERFADTGGLFSELLLAGDESPADVVVGLDTTYLGRALAEDLFQPYEPAALAAVDPQLVVDPGFRLVPFDYGNIVLNYDSQLLPNPPRSWDELADPALEDSIVIMNPATSSPGRNFLLLTVLLFGEEGYLDFWDSLRPNVLTVTAGWSEAYGLYSEGEVPIVLSYETSPVYHIAFEDTDRYRNLVIDGAGYTQIELAGITAHSDVVPQARDVIEFILSQQFQQEIPLSQFMYPVRDDVDLPEAFQAVDRPDRVTYMDGERIDANFDRWLAEWEEVMRQ